MNERGISAKCTFQALRRNSIAQFTELDYNEIEKPFPNLTFGKRFPHKEKEVAATAGPLRKRPDD